MRGYLSLLLTLALLVGAIAIAECIDSEPAATIPPFFTMTGYGERSIEPVLDRPGDESSGRSAVLRFQLPDRMLSIGSDGSETMVIGDRVWNRLPPASWREDDDGAESFAAFQRDLLLQQVRGLRKFVRQGETTGNGPMRGGEPTIRMRWIDPDFPAEVIDGTRSNPDAPPDAWRYISAVYQDATLELTLLVGEQSGRVYEMQQRIDGENVHILQTSVYDYETPVDLEAPE